MASTQPCDQMNGFLRLAIKIACLLHFTRASRYYAHVHTYRAKCMSPIVRTVFLLICSNIFMTFAWYGHLKNLATKPWYIAAFISWGIALFEYLLQVPANRIGYTTLNLAQLKIIQEVITLTVFVPFVVLYMKQSIKLDYLWAALCMLGAVYFIFRK